MKRKKTILSLMEILNNSYNIIWVDDEIDTILSTNEIKGILKLKGINIIAKAHTSTEFRSTMDLHYDKVDSVITDANFNKLTTIPNSERDVSGFEDLRTCIEKYNIKRIIPFYIYSGRSVYLEEKYDNDELEYFVKNERKFSKGELPQMLDQIRKDVDHINSLSFRVRNKYAKELSASAMIEGNEEILLKALLYDYSDEWNNTEDYFNPARKLVERIFWKCKELMIVPPGLSELNSFGRFLQGQNEMYTIMDNEVIMPKPLVRSLDYFLSITQDGSHGAGDLKLEVDSYVRATKNINLFRTILYIAMDLCNWYAKYVYENTDPSNNSTKWKFKEEYKFEHTGKVIMIDSGKYVCKNYQLLKPTNSEYKEGDIIGIKAYIENKSPFSYLNNGQDIMVDKFVFLNKITVLKLKTELDQLD